MSEFLKLAFELISQIIYYLADCVIGLFGGLWNLFVAGWPKYVEIFATYFSEMNLIGQILSILLILLLIAIPVVLITLLVRSIILNIRLKADDTDNSTLYREIGRLNRQVLELMDEKSKILNLKVDATGSNPYMGGIALNEDGTNLVGMPGGAPVGGGMAAPVYGDIDGMADPLMGGMGSLAGVPIAQPDPLMGAAAAIAVAGGSPSSVNGNLSLNAGSMDPSAVADVAIAAANAQAQAKKKAEENERNTVLRFPKLSLVDEKYAGYVPPRFNNEITLQEVARDYRNFACSQMHLYYTPEIVRRFIAGIASSKILILEGISGTGKTSLPYSFSRYLDNPATMVSVQPSYRDRTELLGYFNEFSKRFNETEFLRAIYEASYREEPSFVVLDEMNLARIEYYFAEMLSVLELPNHDEWLLDLVPTAWAGDPIKLDGGKILVPDSLWFIGTANSDDSTFTITDKVYDRAMPIELNERANPFTCELQPRCVLTAAHLKELFLKAKEDYPISEATMTKMAKMDQYLQTRFKLSFGNRIMKQLYDFIPVYVACGGTELGGLDYILARKVLKKFESMNVTFVRDEIKALLEYMEKVFGKSAMPDCRSYLERIQNLY